MPAMSLFKSFALLAALLGSATAQTFTSCNPMNSTDCPTDIALGTEHTFNFDQGISDKIWNQTAGTVNSGQDGAEFTVVQQGDSPTMQSNFYLFFGTVSVVMRAAPGTGIISSIVLESDDLDEVDWEVMGGNTTHIETNYFGKGNTTSFDRAIYYPVNDPQSNFHNYTVIWTNTTLEWAIDGNIVRTLNSHDANGGYDFPQTPMNLRLGIWAGGDSKEPNGTIEWAGGLTDYHKGPFTMYVKSLYAKDYSTGSEYKYGDKTGSWESIQIINGTNKLELESTTQQAVKKWNGLSSGAKIAIGASVGGAALLVVAIFSFCCIKQRRAGRRERAIADAEFEKGTAELMAFRAQMASNQAQKQAFYSQREVYRN